MILLAHIRGRAIRHIVIAVAVGVALLAVAARGETPPAFGRRCIPADCVAPPSNIPDILSRRAFSRGPHGADCAPWGGSAGSLAGLGATPEFHHGLLEPGRASGRSLYCRRHQEASPLSTSSGTPLEL